MNATAPTKSIGAGLNVFLTLVMVFFWMLESLLEDEKEVEKTSRIEVLSDSAFGRLGHVGVYLFLLVLAFVLIATALHQFWNRFVTDVFSLRVITFAEAYAVAIILYIFL